MSKIEELFESYWAGIMQGKHPTYKLFHWHHKNGFMAGANYVLECFESILPFVAKKGIIYGKIKETIEQLKK